MPKLAFVNVRKVMVLTVQNNLFVSLYLPTSSLLLRSEGPLIYLQG